MSLTITDHILSAFLVGRDTTKRINRFLQRIGEAPVIFDTLQANRSEENMLAAVNNLGYLDATITQKRSLGKKKKVRVVYQITPGVRYRVRNIHYQIDDSIINQMLSSRVNSTLYSLLFVSTSSNANNPETSDLPVGSGKDVYCFSSSTVSDSRII